MVEFSKFFKAQVANVPQAFDAGRRTAQVLRQGEQQLEQGDLATRLAELELERAPVVAAQQDKAFEIGAERQAAIDQARQAKSAVSQAKDEEAITKSVQERLLKLEDRDRQRELDQARVVNEVGPEGALQFAAQNPGFFDDEDLEIFQNDPDAASMIAKAASAIGQNLTPSQREFKQLTTGLSESDVDAARRVKLGLQSRATSVKTVDIGGVPHVFDPNSQQLVPAVVNGERVTAQTVGASESGIAEDKARGKGRGESSTRSIESAFESIGKININIANIDRAISALDRGARTGVIDKFLPNVRAASIELGQIQKELALDIVGAVTFGALSKGELDLALDTALLIELDEPELRVFLENKKNAQTKLRDYFQDQISFLDAGGTIAGFLAQQQGGDPLSLARNAIQRGADPEAVRQRLIDMGVDPSGLQ